MAKTKHTATPRPRKFERINASTRNERHEPTLKKTKGLLFAALRVWELKNGYN